MITIRKTCVFDPSAFELMQLTPYTFKTRQIILSSSMPIQNRSNIRHGILLPFLLIYSSFHAQNLNE